MIEDFQYYPLRKFDSIPADILALEQETKGLLTEITKGTTK